MKNLRSKKYIFLFFKGFAMGIADVIPGVSGGTIAFISGIYQELLSSLSKLNFKSVALLTEQGFRAFYKHINGNFLTVLICGIICSVLTFAKFISYLLDSYALFVWSFFLGLVVSSIFLIFKQIQKWHFYNFLILITGILISYGISALPGLDHQNDSYWFLFLSGFLGICAMILPGISGAFILVLLGSYQNILNAIHQGTLGKIFMVILGAIAGLLSFSKILNFLFKNYKDLVLAFLTGFIIGALHKIYPWKIENKNVCPWEFEEPHILFCILLALCGGILIFILEHLQKKHEPCEVSKVER